MDVKFYYIFFTSFLFCNSIRLLNKQKKTINLAFSINNKYVHYLYISLVSLLENSKNNTIYNIYIQINNNFESKRKNLIYKLEKIFFNCYIHFINMKRNFINAYRSGIHVSTYYRLKLPILCPNLSRIIHIDSDSLILKDLMELYTLNFEGKYILGRLDNIIGELDHLGIYTKTYINCGVLLLDLYSLRKNNYVDKFMDYIIRHNNGDYLVHQDQTLINYVCNDKIGLLEPKYHMWPFEHEITIIRLNNRFRTKYNESHLIYDYHHPFIVHFPGSFKLKSRQSKYHTLYKEYLDKLKITKAQKINTLIIILYYHLFILLIAFKIFINN